MSFSFDIEKFAKKAGDTIDEATRTIKLDLFSSIIRDTRVDTGRARSNWSTTTGHPNYNTTERLDPTGNMSIDEARETVRGDTIDYMTNNLPYIQKLEEMDAMVEKNMGRISRIVREVVNDVAN